MCSYFSQATWDCIVKSPRLAWTEKRLLWQVQILVSEKKPQRIYTKGVRVQQIELYLYVVFGLGYLNEYLFYIQDEMLLHFCVSMNKTKKLLNYCFPVITSQLKNSFTAYYIHKAIYNRLNYIFLIQVLL